MNSSNELEQLYAALSAFQGMVEPALKAQENPYFNSKYAGLSEIMETVKEPLNKNGLCLLQILDGSEIVTRLGHISGQWIEGRIQIPVKEGAKPQEYGSAVTYCRRYSLSAILGIVSEADDDAETTEGRYRPNAKLVEWTNRLISKAKEEGKYETALHLIHERLKGNDLVWAKSKIVEAGIS